MRALDALSQSSGQPAAAAAAATDRDETESAQGRATGPSEPIL